MLQISVSTKLTFTGILFVKMAKRKKDEDKFKSFRTMAEDLTEGFRSFAYYPQPSL